MAATNPGAPIIRIHRNKSETTPAHWIVPNALQNWSSYLTTWSGTPRESHDQIEGSQVSSSGSIKGIEDQNAKSGQRTGFKNPWSSWHKPTRKQAWDALEWGEDQDPCIQLAASHARSTYKLPPVAQLGDSKRRKSVEEEKTRSQLAAQLLQTQKPDFTFDPSSERAKTTWLGHAGILVQLPPLEEGQRPIRCIFDPIFSSRCSPSQIAGPIRSYAPPCTVEELPPIDVFMMSHNHHDHLDYDTVMSLWKSNKDWIRFLVPLGNRQWFTECGIDAERVTELDWWEAVDVSRNDSQSLKITCTPNQHNSGRTGFDANTSLWSSWYLEHPQPKPYRVFFAGDTGYQFHDSRKWPPEPPMKDGKILKQKREYQEEKPFPTCPAFEEIAERLGSPDLSLIPVAVGATFSFLRSYVPLPDSVSPFPRHKPGLTAANHMPPWDAVHVFQLMTGNSNTQIEQRPIAVAMHWGTFVPERTEVLKTLGQLEWACIQHDVQFGRSMDDLKTEIHQPGFLALNHGQSIST